MKIIGKGMSNQLSQPRGSIDKNPRKCLQIYLVLRHERNRKHLSFKTNNRVFQMISREYNCDFLRRNRDIHIFIFSAIWIFKFIQFNHTFGTIITRDGVKKAESDGYQWQQDSMTCVNFSVARCASQFPARISKSPLREGDSSSELNCVICGNRADVHRAEAPRTTPKPVLCSMVYFIISTETWMRPVGNIPVTCESTWQ
jgi:hypothetical protein